MIPLSHLYVLTLLYSLNIRQEIRKWPHFDLAGSEIYAVTGTSWVISIESSHSLWFIPYISCYWVRVGLVLSILIPQTWTETPWSDRMNQVELMWEFKQSFALLTCLLDNTGLFPCRWFQSTSVYWIGHEAASGKNTPYGRLHWIVPKPYMTDCI